MRQPKDYSKGKIYVLRNHTNDKVYVGSTTQTLSRRFSVHKCHMETVEKQNRKLYKAMREIGIDQFYIELVEEYPCENVEQLEKREGHFIREYNSFNNGYNGQIQGRSQKDYYEEHKDKMLDQRKQYREKNKAILYEKAKEKIECDVCGIIVSRTHLSRHKKSKYHLSKEYYEENKDKHIQKKEKLRDYFKKYYVKNRDRCLEYSKKYKEENKDIIYGKVECECGKTVCKGALSRHKKTQFHLSKVS